MRRLFFVLFLFVSVSASATIYYVDGDAAPGGDGLSKATANDSLDQALITSLASGDEVRIWGTPKLPAYLTMTGKTNITLRGMEPTVLIVCGTLSTDDFFRGNWTYSKIYGLTFTGNSSNTDAVFFTDSDSNTWIGCTFSGDGTQFRGMFGSLSEYNRLYNCRIISSIYPFGREGIKIVERCTFINCRRVGYSGTKPNSDLDTLRYCILFNNAGDDLCDGYWDEFNGVYCDYNVLDSAWVDDADIAYMGSHVTFRNPGSTIADNAISATEIYSVDTSLIYNSPAATQWEFYVGAEPYYSIRTW